MSRAAIVALVLSCVLLTTAGQIVLKIGVSSPSLQAVLRSAGPAAFLTRAIFAPGVLLGLALYVASTIVWLLVLARAPLSYAYPFVSLGFVLTALYAYYALGESFALTRVAGIALICAGVWLVARS